MKKNISILLMLFLGVSAFAQPKYGNSIYNGQAEIELKIENPIYEFAIEYNSGQNEKGILGLGWVTEFEKNLIAVGDGTFILKSICDCPAKRENYSLIAVDWDASKLSAIVDKMIPLLNNKYKKEELLSNFELRYDLLQGLINSRKWTVPKVEAGQVLYAFESPGMTMKVLEDGYRINDGSKSYTFNKKGKLDKISTSNKVYHLQYNEVQQINAIINAFQQKLEFLYNKEGQLEEVRFDTSVYFRAKYEEGKLTTLKNMVNIYLFSYQSNNLISEIKNSDDEKLIQYRYDTKNKVIFRENNYKKYAYTYNEFYDIKLKKIKTLEIEYFESYDGLDSLKKNYEIEFGINSLGKEYLKQISTDGEGITKNQKFAEGGSCMILEQQDDGVKTYFTYNQRGSLIGKYNDNGAMFRAQVHPVFQKIVQTYDSDENAYWFQYDENELITFIENIEGKRLELVYNENNEIILIQELSKNKPAQILNINYNKRGKPVHIDLEGTGALSIIYDEFDEIKTVKSPAGNKIALTVTQAFQNLLSMTNVAGLNKWSMGNRNGDNHFNYLSKESNDGLVVVGIDSCWGYQDYFDNIMIPTIYEYAADFKDGWGIVRKNLKYGALKTNGSFWLPMEYDYIAQPHNGYIRIKKNEKWGLVNLKGEEIISPKYDYLIDVDDKNYVKVKIGNLWNRINLKGEMFFDKNLEHFSSWNEKFWLVKSNGKFGLIDENAQEILPVKNDWIDYPDANGLFLINNADFWNVGSIKNEKINISKELSPYKDLSIDEYIIKAERQNDEILYGIIDSSGKIVVEPKFKSLTKFIGNKLNGGLDKNYFIAEDSYLSVFINSKGEILSEPTYLENNFLKQNNESCFYYLENDSIYLSCFDSLGVFQHNEDAPVLFTAKKGKLYGLLQQDAQNNKQLNERLTIKYKDLKIISDKFILLKNKRYELYNLENNKTALKNIKDYRALYFGNYDDRLIYVLNTKDGVYFSTLEQEAISQIFQSFQPIDYKLSYIVKTKKGYGIFSLESFKIIIPDEYENIMREDGSFYGLKNGIKQILNFD